MRRVRGATDGSSAPAARRRARGSRAGRERADAARNRTRVLAAAAALFAERGVGSVTMDDVAARAEVGKGTLYRRFGDRSGLAAALLDERESALQARILTGPPPLGPGAPPADRLAAFVQAYLEFVEEVLDLVVLSETSTPGARHRTGAHAFWVTHCRLQLEAAGPPTRACAPTSCSRRSPGSRSGTGAACRVPDRGRHSPASPVPSRHPASADHYRPSCARDHGGCCSGTWPTSRSVIPAAGIPSPGSGPPPQRSSGARTPTAGPPGRARRAAGRGAVGARSRCRAGAARPSRGRALTAAATWAVLGGASLAGHGAALARELDAGDLAAARHAASRRCAGGTRPPRRGRAWPAPAPSRWPRTPPTRSSPRCCGARSPASPGCSATAR